MRHLYVVTATFGRGYRQSVHLAGGPSGWKSLCYKGLPINTAYGSDVEVTCRTCIKKGEGIPRSRPAA